MLSPTSKQASDASDQTPPKSQHEIDALRKLLDNLLELQGWQSTVLSECARRLDRLTAPAGRS